jgi:hypothetical protein
MKRMTVGAHDWIRRILPRDVRDEVAHGTSFHGKLRPSIEEEIAMTHDPGFTLTSERARTLAGRLVEFLETGTPPPELFAPDVFCDFTMPHWRLQAEGIDGLVALRRRGHPGPGSVPRWRSAPTPSGFVIEFEERWHDRGHEWYSREMAWVEVERGLVTSLSVYCTGDWDEARRAAHAREVTLLRP